MELNLKRATIQIEEKPKPQYNLKYDLVQIKQYKKAMSEWPRGSRQWSDFVSEIQAIRRRIRMYRSKRYRVIITLKDWTKSSDSFEINVDSNMELYTEIKRNVSVMVNRSRARSKRMNYSHEIWFDSEVEFIGDHKIGRVLSKPNTFLKLYITKNLQELYEDKKPQTNNNYLGIELEFCAPVSEDDLAIKLFQNKLHKFVQLKKDNSLRPKENEIAFELAILFKETTYKKDLKKVMDILSSVGAQVEDRRCGLHVHIDMRRRNKELVYNNLVACQGTLLTLVDPKRHDNEFCKIVKTKKFPTHFTGERQERYKTINAASYYRHKTLEIRMHEGSVDFKSIVLWVDLLIKVANYKKKLKNNINELTIFKKRFSINNKMFKVALDKKCYWQVNGRSSPSLGLNGTEQPARPLGDQGSVFNITYDIGNAIPSVGTQVWLDESGPLNTTNITTNRG